MNILQALAKFEHSISESKNLSKEKVLFSSLHYKTNDCHRELIEIIRSLVQLSFWYTV